MSFDRTQWQQAGIRRIEQELDRALPAADIAPATLHEAMRYACRGGKRIRALLVYACGEVLDGLPRALDAVAAAVELIHAYSLVHDDMPCMDNDDLRRGQPTVHRQWNEATAVLVGDALQTLAFRVLSRDIEPGFGAEERLACVRALARAAGSRGMCGGQMMDIEGEGRELSLLELETLHILKTGELILVCARMAGHCAPAAPAEHREALEHAAKCLGLAFQIQDDLLDIESSTEELGKTGGKDVVAGKATFPALLGPARARQRMVELFDDARETIAPLPRNDALQALIDQLQIRRA